MRSKKSLPTFWHVYSDGAVKPIVGNYRTGKYTFKSKRKAVALGKKVAAKYLKDGRKKFPLELVTMMDRAHRLGLHETGHALHEAVRKVGWELAINNRRSKPCQYGR